MPAALLDEILHALLGTSDPDARQDALDAGASRLAAAPELWADTARAYLALGTRVMEGCWARGWQPADVVRMAVRDLDDRHVRLTADLIAAAARRDTPGARGTRWTAQLRDTGADVWWTDDGDYLAEVARREALTRFETAGYALETLRLLSRLPGITPLHAEAAEHPHPTAGTGTTGTTGTEPRMLARIRALLAKAESTEFPDEAESLSAKAQELVARYSIDEALLTAGRDGEGGGVRPSAIRIGVDAPYDEAKAMLLDAVCDANRCRTVWSPDFGFATVIGFDTDLDAVELLYTSLLTQATAAMTRADRAGGKPKRASSRSRDFRQSFLIAYADRIGERLARAAEQAKEQAAEEAAADARGGPAAAPERDLLPVLASRAVAVEDAAAQMFPNLVTHRVRIRDEAGWTHGQAAADRAALGPRATLPRPRR
ncbi:DUF2786 domain-containing protein [Yinghuangia aomiensis]|uniref:DUF2786 domain-containing protein n=1 Tax=Yinghuangia aomiensis TaxID=676205 RepID=A0ABP9HXB9_9ACTN